MASSSKAERRLMLGSPPVSMCVGVLFRRGDLPGQDLSTSGASYPRYIEAIYLDRYRYCWTSWQTVGRLGTPGVVSQDDPATCQDRSTLCWGALMAGSDRPRGRNEARRCAGPARTSGTARPGRPRARRRGSSPCRCRRGRLTCCRRHAGSMLTREHDVRDVDVVVLGHRQSARDGKSTGMLDIWTFLGSSASCRATPST